MLEIKEVKKSYGEFQLDCSLNVEKGRITGLVGENGAGKSTLFKAMLGLISYDGGEIKIMGKTPEELNEKEKEELGVVLAEAGFSGYLKGKDVEAVLARLYPRFETEKFHQMCERYQIPLDKFIKEYSTGMKAKLNLIIALTHQAEFLMLDEPTAGLDVGARETMLDILREYMEEDPERSILISSHISSDLEHLCDDIYVIHKGKIILHEEMDTILEKYAVLKVSEAQYQEVDKRYILKEKKESFGISCLTNEKQYYVENYPEIVVESGSLDQVILMLTGGER
jgi:ABC-2 type transport system ATP-binding protein